MKRTLLVLAVSLVGAGMSWAAGSRPNVVFLFADDMGYGEIQALNPERGKIATPHLDQLIKEGMTFTDGHTASSVCSPSRYALLTGRYAWRTKLQHGVIGWDEAPLIDQGRYTMAQLFKDAGYKTAISGKWHLGFKCASQDPGTVFENGPVAHGFDTWFGFHHAEKMNLLCKDNQIKEVIEPSDMLPRMTDFAVDYINQHAAEAKKGQPFFLYVPFCSPHTPILPSGEWVGKSSLGKYGDYVMMTDGMAGKIIQAIDDNGLRDNTIVIFSADNGSSRQAGIAALEKQGHYVSAHLRGSKADLWDGGHRVPLIMRWPNGPFKAGSTNDHLICLSDFMATFAEILGHKLPEHQAEDSFSFWSSLKDQSAPSARQAIVHHSISGMFAIREGKWKLLLARGSGGWTKPDEGTALGMGLPEVQLYDMESDIGEAQNLQADYPEKVQQLETRLTTLVAQGRSTEGLGLKNDVDDIDLWKKKTAENGQKKSKNKKSKKQK